MYITNKIVQQLTLSGSQHTLKATVMRQRNHIICASMSECLLVRMTAPEVVEPTPEVDNLLSTDGELFSWRLLLMPKSVPATMRLHNIMIIIAAILKLPNSAA